MALLNMKQFKDQIGMDNDADSSLEEGSRSPEGGTVAGLQRHVKRTGCEPETAEAAISAPEQTV